MRIQRRKFMRLLFSGKRTWLALVAAMAVVALTLAACTKEVIKEVEVPGETIVIEKEVIKEVQVPGETVVVTETKEVIKEVEVPGKTVVVEKEVIKTVEVEVPGETVVVEKVKEVIKEVLVPGETVVIEKEVIKEVAGEQVIVREVVSVGDWNGSFNWTGPMPETYSEAPMLAAMVAAGTLPPVAERLPLEPFINPVVDEIGEYGGTWRRAFSTPSDGQNYDRIAHDNLIMVEVDENTLYPHIAKGWRSESGDRVFTFYLREGMKWSDGAPFTADDFTFGLESYSYNEAVNPGRGKKLGYSHFAPTYSKIDDYTIRFTFDEPAPTFLRDAAGVCCGFNGYTLHARTGHPVWAPAHYLKQFHKDFVDDPAELDKAATADGYASWGEWFINIANPLVQGSVPNLAPWIVDEGAGIDTTLWELTRNAYYFATDPAGNQLPYIDKISMELIGDSEVLNLKAIAGDLDYQARHIFSQNIPLLIQNGPAEGYEVYVNPSASAEGIRFNLDCCDDDAEMHSWVNNRDFRLALSLGIDRDVINDIIFLDLAKTGWFLPPKGHPFFMDDISPSTNATLDVAKANKILDDIGLTAKDSDGFRTRLDGTGPVIVFLNYLTNYFVDSEAINELVEADWAKNIGIKAVLHGAERSVWENQETARGFMTGTSAPGFRAPEAGPVNPSGQSHRFGLWVQSGGTEGVEPPAAIQRLAEITLAARELPYLDRKDLYTEAWHIQVDQVHIIPIVGGGPAFNNVVVKKLNMRNVVKGVLSDFNQAPGEIHPDQFYFVGGKNDAGF
jgi:peptide/nickel transport system substrate-binding protein